MTKEIVQKKITLKVEFFFFSGNVELQIQKFKSVFEQICSHPHICIDLQMTGSWSLFLNFNVWGFSTECIVIGLRFGSFDAFHRIIYKPVFCYFESRYHFFFLKNLHSCWHFILKRNKLHLEWNIKNILEKTSFIYLKNSTGSLKLFLYLLK